MKNNLTKMVDAGRYRQNLRKIRMALGMTAKELSEKSGLRQLKRVSDIEEGRGDPNLMEVISIAKALGVSFEAMITLDAHINITFK